MHIYQANLYVQFYLYDSEISYGFHSDRTERLAFSLILLIDLRLDVQTIIHYQVSTLSEENKQCYRVLQRVDDHISPLSFDILFVE